MARLFPLKSHSVQVLSSNYLERTFDVRCEFVGVSLVQFEYEVTFATPFSRGISWKLRLTMNPGSSVHRQHMYGYNYETNRSRDTAASDGPGYEIELSANWEDKLQVNGQALATVQKMRIKKDPGYQGDVKCSDCLTVDLQNAKKVRIGSGKALEPYIEDGKMAVYLCLTICNDYNPEQKATAVKLYTSFENRHCDFEIKTSDGSLKVFRSILCLKWPYFETMMDAKYVESSSKIWTVNDISLKTMKDIVIYVYCDAITFKDTQQVIEILKAAHRYQLQQLVRDCAKYLLWEIEFKDALEVIVLSDLYRLHELKVKCCNLISKALVQTDMKDLPGYGEFSKYAGLLRLTQDCLQLSVREFYSKDSSRNNKLM
ncbi:Protein maternal effect lethal 26 [Halotydeus destructor]|nr:Protein maternal effect lethal 26 [Halotydeus destructor]